MPGATLPPKAFESWEKTRQRGCTRHVLWGALWGTPVLFGLFTLPIFLALRMHWDGWQGIFVILRALAWGSPILSAAIAYFFWSSMEQAYQATLLAQGKTPPPLPPDAAPADFNSERSAPSPPVIFTTQQTAMPTLWICANPTRMGARLAIMTGAAWALIDELPMALRNGDFVAPLVFATFFLLLLPRALEGGCQLDRHGKKLLRWYGIPLPFLSRHINFSQILELRLSNGKRPGGRGDTWCHIAAVTATRTILVKRFDYRPEARKFAENLAREIGQMGVTETT